MRKNCVLDSTHLLGECFAEIRAEERANCQRETSSVILAAVEPCGVERIMRAEDYGKLQRFIRVTVFVLKFGRIMKSLLKKDTLLPDRLTDQDIAVGEPFGLRKYRSPSARILSSIFGRSSFATSPIIRAL